MQRNHAQRGPLTTLGFGIGMTLLASVVLASPAGASDDPFADVTPVDIGEGRGAVDVGDAWFARVESAGSEQLHVRLTVESGFDMAHLCLSDVAFAERVPPGQCPWQIPGPGPTGELVVDLEDEYLAAPLHVQLHVDLAGDGSAFAGNTTGGGSFFGEVVVETADEEENTTEVVENTENINTQNTETTQNTDTQVDENTSQDDGEDSDEVELIDPVEVERVDDVPAAGPQALPTAPKPADSSISVTPAPTAAASAAAVAAPAPTHRDVEVRGVQYPRTAWETLPRTGLDVGDLAIIASGLLLAGAGLITVSRPSLGAA